MFSNPIRIKKVVGERVYRDAGSNGISSSVGATVSVVVQRDVKEGSTTAMMEEIVDKHDAAYHDPGDPWPSPYCFFQSNFP